MVNLITNLQHAQLSYIMLVLKPVLIKHIFHLNNAFMEITSVSFKIEATAMTRQNQFTKPSVCTEKTQISVGLLVKLLLNLLYTNGFFLLF